MSEASVKAEVLLKNADADANAKIMKARGDAESITIIADANFLAKQNEAKGIQRIKEAEANGILALRMAEAKGLECLVASAGGIEELARYMIVRDDILPKIAKEQASAISGLKPNINIWQTGSSGDQGSYFSNVMKDIVTSGIPLMDGLKQQTGIDIMAQLIKKDTISQ